MNPGSERRLFLRLQCWTDRLILVPPKLPASCTKCCVRILKQRKHQYKIFKFHTNVWNWADFDGNTWCIKSARKEIQNIKANKSLGHKPFQWGKTSASVGDIHLHHNDSATVVLKWSNQSIKLVKRKTKPTPTTTKEPSQHFGRGVREIQTHG